MLFLVARKWQGRSNSVTKNIVVEKEFTALLDTLEVEKEADCMLLIVGTCVRANYLSLRDATSKQKR